MQPDAPNRRDFIRTSALTAAAAAVGCAALSEPAAAREDDSQFVREAQFYEKQPNRKIKCKLCPRECVIDDRERGYCGVRENRGGTYYTLVHSRVVTAHIDTVEKKPLFHFHPGTLPFSLAHAEGNLT